MFPEMSVTNHIMSVSVFTSVGVGCLAYLRYHLCLSCIDGVSIIPEILRYHIVSVMNHIVSVMNHIMSVMNHIMSVMNHIMSVMNHIVSVMNHIVSVIIPDKSQCISME